MKRRLQQLVIIEDHDLKSNHVWRYEVDFIKIEINIFKNNEWARTVHCVEAISDAWLFSMREGL